MRQQCGSAALSNEALPAKEVQQPPASGDHERLPSCCMTALSQQRFTAFVYGPLVVRRPQALRLLGTPTVGLSFLH
jgi:hypothetical protein